MSMHTVSVMPFELSAISKYNDLKAACYNSVCGNSMTHMVIRPMNVTKT